MDGLRELIAQIRAALQANVYYLALFGVLALPDICGALASDNGQASKSKTVEWIRQNVPEQAADAEMLYGLRCSLLHQGRAHPHGNAFPMALTVVGGGIHKLSIEVDGQRVGWAHLPLLVGEITTGAERWLDNFGHTQRVQTNLAKFAHLRLEGLPPHVVGAPVIA